MGPSILEICKEVDSFFGTAPSVQRAVARLAHNMEKFGIPFAISGDLAVTAHGYRETTARPAILIRPDDEQRFKAAYVRYGYEERDANSLAFRDAENDVDFALHLVGDYPGTGGINASRFPAPGDVEMGADGIPIMSLALLLNTKLAICAANPHAYRHMADAIGLIRVNQLTPDFAGKFDPTFEALYHHFWKLAQIEDEH